MKDRNPCTLRIPVYLYAFSFIAIGWMEELIAKNKNIFTMPIDRTQAAYAVYSVMAAQIILYIFNQAMTYEELLGNIREQVHFIFAGKIRS